MIRSLGGRTITAHGAPPIAIPRPKAAADTAESVGPGFIGCTAESFDTTDSSVVTADLTWVKAADVTTGNISTVPASDLGEIADDTLTVATGDDAHTHVRPTIELSGACATVHATITPPSSADGVVPNNIGTTQQMSLICRDTMGQVAASSSANFCGWHFLVWRIREPTIVLPPFDPVESGWFATIAVRRGAFWYWWNVSGTPALAATQTGTDYRVRGVPGVNSIAGAAAVDHVDLAGLNPGDVLRLDVAGAGGSTTADAYINDVLVHSADAGFIAALQSAHPGFLSDMETYGTQGGLSMCAGEVSGYWPPYDMAWDDFEACVALPGTAGDPFPILGDIDGGGP